MNRFFEWLLDLEHIRLGGDAPVVLKWDSDVQPWMVLCVALAGVALVTLAYRRERVSVIRRIAPAVLRCGLIALVVAVICRPALVLQRDRVEPSYVAVLVDTSMSMAAREPYVDGSLARAVADGVGLEDVAELAEHSRLELLKTALTRNDAAALRGLLERNGLQLSTFAGTVERLAVVSRPSLRSARALVAGSYDGLKALVGHLEATIADGSSTRLGGAIEQVIEDAAGRRLAAIVLATDGQTTEPGGLSRALDLALDRKIPIYPLRGGSPLRPLDLVVGPPRAEESFFINDVLAVEGRITAYGLTEPTPVTVRLVDESDGRVVASQRIMLDGEGADVAASRGTGGGTGVTITVELRARPTRPGRIRYRVEAGPLPGERATGNNADRVDVIILEEPLRVLFVDGYPRYEYRFLKNALLREDTVELSVLLLEADDEFVQEGTDAVRRFPDTPENLNRYDVVLLGDVDPRAGFLTEAQMKMLLDYVGHRGGGFGLLAGERAAPHRFLGTPLEKLIPVHIDPDFVGRYEGPLTTGFHARLTPEGKRSRFFRLTPEETPGQTDGEFESLPELYWIARTLGPKAGATVLVEHPAASYIATGQASAQPMPVVVTGRYGAGRIFFQATDDTWRWRRHRMDGVPAGELFHDTYWVQVVRMLAQPVRASRDRRYILRTDRRVYAYGRPVQTRVEVLDSELLAEQGDVISLVVRSYGPSGSSEPKPADSIPPSSPQALRHSPFLTGRFDVHRLSPESNRFEGSYIPPGPGSFSIQAEELAPPVGEKPVSVTITIKRPDLEGRRPEANHEVLQRIADSTGGRLVDLDRLETELAAIEDRSARIPDDITEPLWDSKLVLVIFVLMISMEWIMRKAFGLL